MFSLNSEKHSRCLALCIVCRSFLVKMFKLFGAAGSKFTFSIEGKARVLFFCVSLCC